MTMLTIYKKHLKIIVVAGWKLILYLENHQLLKENYYIHVCNELTVFSAKLILIKKGFQTGEVRFEFTLQEEKTLKTEKTCDLCWFEIYKKIKIK